MHAKASECLEMPKIAKQWLEMPRIAKQCLEMPIRNASKYLAQFTKIINSWWKSRNKILNESILAQKFSYWNFQFQKPRHFFAFWCPVLFGLTTGVGPTNSAQVTTRQHKLEKIGKPGSRINWRLSVCILQSRFSSKQASLGWAGSKTNDKWKLSYL